MCPLYEAKFKFQGQSAISQRWFDLDLDWIEVNFSTSEPDFYRKKFQSHNMSILNEFICIYYILCFNYHNLFSILVQY